MDFVIFRAKADYALKPLLGFFHRRKVGGRLIDRKPVSAGGNPRPDIDVCPVE